MATALTLLGLWIAVTALMVGWLALLSRVLAHVRMPLTRRRRRMAAEFLGEEPPVGAATGFTPPWSPRAMVGYVAISVPIALAGVLVLVARHQQREVIATDGSLYVLRRKHRWLGGRRRVLVGHWPRSGLTVNERRRFSGVVVTIGGEDILLMPGQDRAIFPPHGAT